MGLVLANLLGIMMTHSRENRFQPTRALEGDAEYWLMVDWWVVDIRRMMNQLSYYNITISIGHDHVTVIINSVQTSSMISVYMNIYVVYGWKYCRPTFWILLANWFTVMQCPVKVSRYSMLIWIMIISCRNMTIIRQYQLLYCNYAWLDNSMQHDCQYQLS